MATYSLITHLPAAAVLLAATVLPFNPVVHAADSLEPVLYMQIIVDASGSMAQSVSGKSKMTWARQALRKAVDQLQERDTSAALRAYGFDSSLGKTAAASCPNTELLVPFARRYKQDIQNAVHGLIPYGYTPIADSLKLAGKDLEPYLHKPTQILLISDGIETCGGDPVAVAKTLCKQGIDMQLNVIGFDLDAKAKKQMQAVAEQCGAYFDARNADALDDQLKLALGEVKKTVKSIAPERFSNPVEGGTTIDTAEPLEAGIYTLKQAVNKGDRRYFSVLTQTGEHAMIRSNIQTYESDLKRGKAKIEAGFSVHIHRPDGSKIKGRSALVRKTRGKDLETGFMDLSGEGFFFAIGDDYVTTHKDAKFELIIAEAGDLKPGSEAMDKPDANTAMLHAGEAYIAHLGLEDRADSFIYTGSQPGQLEISFTDPTFRLKVEVFDADNGKRLSRHVKLTGTAVIPMPALAGGIFVRISDANPSLYNMFSAYEIRIIE